MSTQTLGDSREGEALKEASACATFHESTMKGREIDLEQRD
jgi:hypothetical protein